MADKNLFCFVVDENVIKMDYDIIDKRPNLNAFLCKKSSDVSLYIDCFDFSSYDLTYNYYYDNPKILKKKVAFLKELGWKQVKKLK